jgi:glycosyltransferase involved in cell wall biosynthesis/peptidoglycan/xylan/chitin deacetylase (PgdA/CDA1 family)
MLRRERRGHGVPGVAAVIIFLNEERFLGEAIESVLGQTLSDWELCLVDDGSTDGSGQIAEDYCRHDARIRLVTHPGGENRGMSASRNLGLRETTGKYLAYLDADDIWLPEKLEHQVAILERQPRAAAVFGPACMWLSWDAADDVPWDFENRLAMEADVLHEPPSLLPFLLADPNLEPAMCGTLIRRDALVRAGGFEEEFHDMYEDKIMWWKLMAEEPVYVTRRSLDRYRQHSDRSCEQAHHDGRLHPLYPNPARGAFLEWIDEHRPRTRLDPQLERDLAHELRYYRYTLPPVQVEAVDLLVDEEQVRGHYVDFPVVGDVTGTDRIEISGWVVGRDAPAVRVEIHTGGKRVAQTAVNRPRPDLPAVFPDHSEAGFSGYRLAVPLIGTRSLDVLVRAVLADGSSVDLATISARRPPRLESLPGSQRRAARWCPVLLYHRVADDELDPWNLNVSPSTFDGHLELLRSQFEPISLDAAVSAAANGGLLPERAVVVTFDDGYLDNSSVGAPLLEKHDVPATFFVVTSAIDAPAFWWDVLYDIVAAAADRVPGFAVEADGARVEVSSDDLPVVSDLYQALWRQLLPLAAPVQDEVLARLAESCGLAEVAVRYPPLSPRELQRLAQCDLFAVGAHTVHHRPLDLLPPDVQLTEIADSRRALETMTDRPVMAFSYPFGRCGAATPDLVRKAGFSAACLAEPAPANAGVDVFRLPRIDTARCTVEHLEELLSIQVSARAC